MKINIPVSVGELVDKLTILEIKKMMIKDVDKLREVENEQSQLNQKLNDIVQDSVEFDTSLLFALKADLFEINLSLWSIEDNIRYCEKIKDFSAEFIRLARDVYHANDKRFSLKNEINKITNSHVKEVKSYESYS